MTHSIKLSDEAYRILLRIAKEEGRSVTKQIEVLAKKLERVCITSNNEEINGIFLRDSYIEALKQAEKRDVIRVGTFETVEELDEKLGI
ncbi:MAG: hypothetical protein LBJ92_01175 [Holosporales bacterium]|jgi:predicted CopG family antitoxin|nr:hypothetical protein [Holosporales bacterium]